MRMGSCSKEKMREMKMKTNIRKEVRDTNMSQLWKLLRSSAAS